MSQYNDVAKLDVLQRINYLYQAAHLALKQGPGGVTLARFYVQTLVSIAQKNVIRLDPSIKRTLCKRCHSLLLPGVTSTVRIQQKRRRSQRIVTCLQCRSIKRFAVNPAHQLWGDSPEAWLGMLPAGKTIVEAGLGKLPVVKEISATDVGMLPIGETTSDTKLNVVVSVNEKILI